MSWSRLFEKAPSLMLGIGAGIAMYLKKSLEDSNAMSSYKYALCEDQTRLHQTTNTSGQLLKLKHTGMIVQYTFDALGFEGPVIVKFNNNDDCSAAWYPYRNKGLAYIQFSVNEALNRSDEEIFGIAGHEAIHIWHRHSKFRSVMNTAVTTSTLSASSLYTYQTYQRIVHSSQPLNLGMVYCAGILLGLIALRQFALRTFDKLCELDADISSAVLLGGAKGFASDLAKITPRKHIGYFNFLFKDTHPPLQTRINYLTKLRDKCPSPRLFQAPIYQKILQEREKALQTESKNYSNKELADYVYRRKNR